MRIYHSFCVLKSIKQLCHDVWRSYSCLSKKNIQKNTILLVLVITVAYQNVKVIFTLNVMGNESKLALVYLNFWEIIVKLSLGNHLRKDVFQLQMYPLTIILILKRNLKEITQMTHYQSHCLKQFLDHTRLVEKEVDNLIEKINFFEPENNVLKVENDKQ